MKKKRGKNRKLKYYIEKIEIEIKLWEPLRLYQGMLGAGPPGDVTMMTAEGPAGNIILLEIRCVLAIAQGRELQCSRPEAFCLLKF